MGNEGTAGNEGTVCSSPISLSSPSSQPFPHFPRFPSVPSLSPVPGPSMSPSPASDEVKIVSHNRKAAHDYFLEDRFEAGIILTGTEIKSVREGQVQLKEAYVQVTGREVFLINAHIAVYNPASRTNHDPRRPRKLLLHKKEIAKLSEQTQLKGYTIVPTKMYLSKGRAKLEIVLARGKKNYDKRQDIAERDSKRDIERALRER